MKKKGKEAYIYASFLILSAHCEQYLFAGRTLYAILIAHNTKHEERNTKSGTKRWSTKREELNRKNK